MAQHSKERRRCVMKDRDTWRRSTHRQTSGGEKGRKTPYRRNLNDDGFGRKAKMRRTKEWWAMLTAYERGVLWYLERATQSYGSAYLPTGYSECSFCSIPTYSGGLCSKCYDEWHHLTHKPVRLLIRKRAYEIAAKNGWPPRRARYLARTGGRGYIRAVAASPENLDK